MPTKHKPKKAPQKIPVTWLISPRLREAVKRAARAERRSQTAYVELALLRAMGMTPAEFDAMPDQAENPTPTPATSM